MRHLPACLRPGLRPLSAVIHAKGFHPINLSDSDRFIGCDLLALYMATTMHHLNQQAERIDQLMGWPKGTSNVNEGSKMYGVAFRLFIINEHTGAHMTHPFGDYLGDTKPEAFASLCRINQVIFAMQGRARYGGPGVTLDAWVSSLRFDHPDA